MIGPRFTSYRCPDRGCNRSRLCLGKVGCRPGQLVVALVGRLVPTCCLSGHPKVLGVQIRCRDLVELVSETLTLGPENFPIERGLSRPLSHSSLTTRHGS